MVIATVEQKIAEWTHLPPDHGEPLQILRYVDGQQYGAHWDWFDDPVHHSAYLQDGNRYATEQDDHQHEPLDHPIHVFHF